MHKAAVGAASRDHCGTVVSTPEKVVPGVQAEPPHGQSRAMAVDAIALQDGQNLFTEVHLSRGRRGKQTLLDFGSRCLLTAGPDDHPRVCGQTDQQEK